MTDSPEPLPGHVSPLACRSARHGKLALYLCNCLDASRRPLVCSVKTSLFELCYPPPTKLMTPFDSTPGPTLQTHV